MRPWFHAWVRKIHWRRERPPTPVFWPGEFNGLYSSWRRKELDMTERLSLHFTLTVFTVAITNNDDLYVKIYRKRHIPFSRCCVFSHVLLFAAPWILARQAPLSMDFSRQEYWSLLPFPFPGDLPSPRIEPLSLLSPALASRYFTTSTTSRCYDSRVVI